MNKHSPAKCVIRATEMRQIEIRLQPSVYVPLKSNREQIMAGEFRLSGAMRMISLLPQLVGS